MPSFILKRKNVKIKYHIELNKLFYIFTYSLMNMISDKLHQKPRPEAEDLDIHTYERRGDIQAKTW